MSKQCNCQPSQLPDAEEVSWPCPALGHPECRTAPKEPCLVRARGKQTLVQPSEIPILPPLAKHVASDNKQGVLRPVETHVHVCSWVLMVHWVKQRGFPLCLWHSSSTETDNYFSAKSKAVRKMSGKDSSVTTSFNLSWQVKRNINCLFMSSPPTADWCRIPCRVALKRKVGVIICLKYFSSFQVLFQKLSEDCHSTDVLVRHIHPLPFSTGVYSPVIYTVFPAMTVS